MFERFTDRARRVIVLAQEESRLLSHDYIGTEHLLLGLVHEDEGLAHSVLLSLHFTLADARDEVKTRVPPGNQAPSGHIPFSPRAKKVMELGLRQALRFGHDYIGTEHILLALVTEGEGVGAQVLTAKIEGGLEAVEDTTLATMVAAGTIDKGSQFQVRMGRRMERVGRRHVTLSGADPDVLVRLEAIEARLSAIEALLRAQGEEREAQ